MAPGLSADGKARFEVEFVAAGVGMGAGEAGAELCGGCERAFPCRIQHAPDDNTGRGVVGDSALKNRFGALDRKSVV